MSDAVRVKLQGISKHFGTVQALKPMDLDVEPGVLGPDQSPTRHPINGRSV